MPVMLTIGELALEMRLAADPSDVPAEYMGILSRALDAAKETVDLYAGDDTPQATLDLAAAKMAGYLVDVPTVMRQPAIAFRNSGCESLLSPWHLPIGVKI